MVSPSEDLGSSYYVTLVARLHINSEGTVVSGELTGTDGNNVRRFQGWSGLIASIREYVAATRDSPDQWDLLDD